jgi:hypothetical protein
LAIALARRPAATACAAVQPASSLLGHWAPAGLAAPCPGSPARRASEARCQRATDPVLKGRFAPIASEPSHRSELDGPGVSKADLAVEFVKPGSPEAEAVERVLLKEVERPKLLPSEVVAKVKPPVIPHSTCMITRCS